MKKWSITAASAIAVLWALQSAHADDCFYGGTAYAPGAVACQLGLEHRCENGSWTRTGVACPQPVATASRACEFNGAAYSDGATMCQVGQRYRCNDGLWTNLRSGCVTMQTASRDHESILAPAQAADMVVPVNVDARDGVVTGKLVNRSPNPVRNVELIVRHAWMWSDERHPGDDSPGRTSFFTVRAQIPPRAAIPFEYRDTRPLPARSDGHFRTTVQVVKFTEVGS